MNTIGANSEVQEVHLPNYELELDFVNNSIEQEKFFNKSEQELIIEEITTITFNNVLFPYANMVSITPSQKHINYEISLTFWRHKWQGTKPLNKFILSFLRSCNNKGINLQLEATDLHGYYLLAKLKVVGDTSIKQRIEEVSLQLSDIMKKLN